MELHFPTSAKKLWDYLRAIMFMLRIKSIISKRKFLMDMNLFRNRSKVMGKSLTKLVFHPHHHSISKSHVISLRDYEFSCSSNTNTPDPMFFRAKNKQSKKKKNFLSCILNPVVNGEEEEGEGETDIRTPLRIEYNKSQELLYGMMTRGASPFSVRVSDFSALEEETGGGGTGGVDHEAEEFIKRFYEQLRAQSNVALLEYPETQE